MYGQTRILMSMSRDGLIPRVFERVSPKTVDAGRQHLDRRRRLRRPGRLRVPLDVVVNLTTIGTLATMAVVNVAVIVLRRRDPDLRRTFRVPLYPADPARWASASALYLMYGTGWTTWVQFAVFLAVGVLVYALYGRRHSRSPRGAQ